MMKSLKIEKVEDLNKEENIINCIKKWLKTYKN
jgi:hypothetical protein